MCYIHKSRCEFVAQWCEIVFAGIEFCDEFVVHEFRQAIGENLGIGVANGCANFGKTMMSFLYGVQNEECPFFTHERKEGLNVGTFALRISNHKIF